MNQEKIKIKIPQWLRIFYIISGSISIIFAIIVLINIKFGYLITAILFGIALITIGVTRIFVGIFDKQQSKWLNRFNIAIGVLLIPIGLIAIIKHDITVRLVFVFIAVAFVLIGIVGVVKGFEEKAKESISRLLLIIYGFILILVGIIDLAIDEIAKITLIVILSTGFIVIGVRRLTEGVIGYTTKIIQEEKSNTLEKKS